MSIRSNSLPLRGDLSWELQDLLRRNGMQGHIIREGDVWKLAVQGHDSPLITYNITPQQMKALCNWGSNYANKTAYNTFAELVEKDFYIPKNFVHARNANGRVAMGLHGYRIGVGEYGRMPMERAMMWGFPHRAFLGWTPRQQAGWHMRRVGGALFMQGAPMVPERPDYRMKPGELQSGGYGFYYKGNTQDVPAPRRDVLDDLKTVITPVQIPPRPREDAKPYKELVTSEVYFSDEKWRECLQSHGLVVDPEKKTLTVQSAATRQDFVYDITDEELKAFTSNSLKEIPLRSRIDTLNVIIRNDFEDKITMDMLNSKQQISIKLRPEVEAELNHPLSMQDDTIVAMDGQQLPLQAEKEDKSIAHVDGNSLYELNESKGWYREGVHGREVNVDDIKVEPVRNEQGELEKDKKGEVKYRMTAIINGESISHDITQKQYDKFMAIDDYHRMKLFSHIFNEVDMKTVPGMEANVGAKIGGALLAGLAVMGELTHGHHHCGPVIFEEHFEGRPHTVYMKPGVDSPHDIAARAFEAGLNAGEHGVGLGHSR